MANDYTVHVEDDYPPEGTIDDEDVDAEGLVVVIS
jgi:hypothetical protein